MMTGSLLAVFAASLAVIVPHTTAQLISTNATCNSTGSFDWAFNSLGQSPCLVAAYLGSVCSAGQFFVPALGPSQFYSGPNVENANDCRCNSVFYSTISACAACQGNEYLKWSSWYTNCSSVFVSEYPEDIPTGTKVPHWAYENVTIGDGAFNTTVAKAETSSPESTGTPKPTGTAPASPSNSPAASGSKPKKSHAGAIAGGVIGGLVGLAIVAGLIFWLIRRRRTPKAPSSLVNTLPGASNPMSYTSVTPFPTGAVQAPKLYNPSDPSTFPTTPSIYSTPEQHTMYTGNTQSDSSRFARPQFSGAAEL